MSDLFGPPPSPSDRDDPLDRSTSNPTGADSIPDPWLEVEAELDRSPEPVTASSPEPAFKDRRIDPSGTLVMVETAFLASAASLVWLVNYYFPIGPVLRIFFPIPIALIYLRWGHRAAWMGALVSGLLLSVLMGPVRSLQYVIPFGLMGVLLGLLWRRRAKWSTSIFLGTLLGTLGFFFRIWLVSLLLSDDLWLYATTQVTDFLDWLFIKLGLLVQPSLWMVQLAIVVMVFLNNLVYLFVVHLVAWLMLERLGNPIPQPPKWVQVLMEYEEES